MEMKRKLSLLLVVTLSLSLLSGCASKGKDSLSDIPSMTLDEVAGSRLVASTN